MSHTFMSHVTYGSYHTYESYHTHESCPMSQISATLLVYSALITPVLVGFYTNAPVHILKSPFYTSFFFGADKSSRTFENVYQCSSGFTVTHQYKFSKVFFADILYGVFSSARTFENICQCLSSCKPMRRYKFSKVLSTLV